MCEPANKNVLVVGASSYIGTFLCNYFREKKNGVVQLSTAECNLLDPASVRDFFSTLPQKEYVVVFLATVNRPKANSIESFKDNINMLENFVQNIDLNNISSLIYFSSVKVYGDQPELPISEKTITNPIDWYSLSKLNSEWMLDYYLREELPITILRIPGIYGKSQRERSIIGNFIEDIRQNRKVEIFGTGLSQRDYVFVNDLVRIVEQIVLAPKNKEVELLNIATGKSYSILEILEKIRSVLEIDFVVEYSVREESIFDLKFDTTKFVNVLPSFNFSSLENGICSYLS